MNKIHAEVEFKVEFYDVDLMGIVYHGNYLKFFELARWALFEKIQYNYADMARDDCSFPVATVSVKYIRPLRFGDRVRAAATLEEYENCIQMKFELFNAETGELTTRGKTTQMAFYLSQNRSSFRCPPRFIAQVEAALARGPA